MFSCSPTVLHRKPHVCFQSSQCSLVFFLKPFGTMQTVKQTLEHDRLTLPLISGHSDTKEESGSTLYKWHPFGRDFPVSKMPGRKCYIERDKCLSLWNRAFQFLIYLSSATSRFSHSKVGRQSHLYEHVPGSQEEMKLFTNANFLLIFTRQCSLISPFQEAAPFISSQYTECLLGLCLSVGDCLPSISGLSVWLEYLADSNRL